MQRLFWFPLLAMTLGCEPAKTTPTTGSAAEAVIVIPPLNFEPIKLDSLSYDDVQKLIASKKGKLVVVDAWSTYCEPCLKEFHGLVELHKKYGPDKVACISLCTNFSGLGKPEDELREPLMFLMSQDATFDNVLSTEADTKLYKKLGIASIPAIFVYDRDGKLLKTFDLEPKYSEVEKFIEPLLAK